MKRFIASLAVVCMITTLTNTNVAFADLNDGLVAYYPFNGSANDESGNGNNGTVYGATLTTDRFGNTNKAYSFDGVDDYVEASKTSLSISNSYTVSSWMKYYWQSHRIWALYFGHSGNCNNNGFHMLINVNNEWYETNYPVDKGDTQFGPFCGTQNIFGISDSEQKWVNIATVFDATNMVQKLYINSVLVDSDSVSAIPNIENYPLYIAKPADYWPSSYFKGSLDEIRIYNRALLESEIQELYNEGGSTTPTPTPTPTATPTATLVQTPTPTPTVTPTPTPSETWVVFGYVYDEDENPLRSVTVKIDGDDYSDSVTTDEDGYYEFNNVPTGDYTITYTKTGYETQTMEVTVEEGDAVQVDSVTMPVVQKGSIYGYATDIRGNPLESVRLKLVGIGIKAKKTASTDSDGFFEFKDLETGIYRIVAKKRFYKAAQQTVALEEGEDKEIEIEMKKTTKRIKLEGVLD